MNYSERIHNRLAAHPGKVRADAAAIAAEADAEIHALRKEAERYRWLRSVGADRGVIDWAALQVHPHDLAAMDCVIDASIHLGIAAALLADAPGAA